MFEFVTISNGVAVVQHGATGHVYRFRPMQPGVWSQLTLDRMDECHTAESSAEVHATAALAFAEQAAGACHGTGAEPEHRPAFGSNPDFLRMRWVRRSFPQHGTR